MFRSPNDPSSSDSSSDEEIEISRISSKKSNTDDYASSVNSQPANLITASLLESYYCVRAAELLSANSSGTRYDRHSPEARALAKQMFATGSQLLASHGLVAGNLHNDELQDKRQQYLKGIDSIGVGPLREAGILPPPAKLALEAPESARGMISQLALDALAKQEDGLPSQLIERISIPAPMPGFQLLNPRVLGVSRYNTEFAEVKVLGQGGFGTVYHVVNFVDSQPYAIKKIRLDSRRLKRKWQDGRYEELEHVLREIRTLASLEHSNIVRYYNAWIEDPSISSMGMVSVADTELPNSRKLLKQQSPEDESTRSPSISQDDGIVFGEDSKAQKSSRASQVEDQATSSTVSFSNETDIYTDGDGNNGQRVISYGNDQITLCLQMSFHPMNLATYLSPLPPMRTTPARSAATTLPASPNARHCFHLQPSLSIFLGILSGVQYLHSTGIVHRDIKPANIFLSEDCVPRPGFVVASCAECPDQQQSRYLNARIGDFGLVGSIAEDVQRPASCSTRIVGTELYRPPLQNSTIGMSNGKDKSAAITGVDEKLDVFALGVLLFELLWRFDTRAERSIVLSTLTRSATLPPGFASTFARKDVKSENRIAESEIEKTSAQSSAGDLIAQCITGMVNSHPETRWHCDQVRDRIEFVLQMCKL